MSTTLDLATIEDMLAELDRRGLDVTMTVSWRTGAQYMDRPRDDPAHIYATPDMRPPRAFAAHHSLGAWCAMTAAAAAEPNPEVADAYRQMGRSFGRIAQSLLGGTPPAATT